MNLSTIRDNSFLNGLSDTATAFLESVAVDVEFGPGEMLFDENAVADKFYIIRHGLVGLELTSPGGPPLVIQTLRDNELVGVSWLIPPFRWEWRARAVKPTTAVEFDAAAVRERCEGDCELDRQILRGIVTAASTRLHSTRTQLLDLYGERR